MHPLTNNRLLSRTFEGDGHEILPYDAETADQTMSSQLDTVIDYEEKQQGLLQVLTELGALRQAAEALNQKNRWSKESLALFGLHLESIANRLDVTTEEYEISQCSVNVGRSEAISLEGLDRLIDDVKEASNLMQQDAIDGMYAVLKNACENLTKLSTQANALAERARKTAVRSYLKDIEFKDDAVVGLLPPAEDVEKIEDQLSQYLALQDRLLDPYVQCAFRSLMASSRLQDLLNGDPAYFWQGIEKFLSQLEDPRTALTREQLTYKLPGFSALFTNVPSTTEDELSPSQQLSKFIDCNVPVSVNAFGIAQRSVKAGSYSYPAANSRSVLQILTRLNQQFAKLNLKKLNENLKSAWQDALRTQSILDASLKHLNPTFMAALDGDANQINDFIFRLYTLSSWPIVNSVLHLSIYTAAMITYCNESLRAEPIDSKQYEAQKKARDVAKTPTENAEDKAVKRTAELVAKSKPEEDDVSDPDEVSDTGDDPDRPKHATGVPKREIVEGVEETIEKAKEEQSSQAENDSEQEEAGESDTGEEPAGEESASEEVDATDKEESEDEEEDEEAVDAAEKESSDETS